MRRGISSSILVFSLPLLLALCAPAFAQIHGVPASVTSFGFGGNDNPAPGVRASVTSLGPNGFGSSRSHFGSWNTGFFFTSNGMVPRTTPPLLPRRDRHDREHRDRIVFLPYSIPAFIPYGIAYDETPYAAEYQEDDSGDYPEPDSAYREITRKRAPGTARKRPAPDDDAREKSSDQTPAPVEQPVTQPPTVLVFKDGRHSDIVNYAIVGDTLFDFDEGRTRRILLADLDLPATQKANGERGVEFEIPAAK